jgi:hypothetical protein
MHFLILKNLSFPQINIISIDEELLEIKELLQTYLAHKVVHEANKFFSEKNYTGEIFEQWKEGHYRKKAS